MSIKDELDVATRISRRGFLKVGGTAMGAVVLGGLTGCSDDVTKVTGNDSSGTTTETAWYGAEPTIGTIVEEVTTDILVCGAGHGGLNAALNSAYRGIKTLVIEKAKSHHVIREQLGLVGATCQNNVSPNADMSKAEILNELGRYASNHCDLGLIRMWLDESGATGDFLASQVASAGFELRSEYDDGTGYRGIYKEYPTMTKFVVPGKETHVSQGPNVGSEVADATQKLGAEFRYSTALVKLITDSSGSVTGAYARNDKGYIKITANKGVLLATGGYLGDKDLYVKLSPYAANVTTVHTGMTVSENTGDGIKAGIWAGGVKQEDPSTMLFDRGGVAPGVKAGYPFAGTMAGYIWMGSQLFLKVDLNGKRFCNESAPYDTPSFASRYLKNGVYCMVFDANYWTNIEAFHTTGCSRLVPSTSVPVTGEGFGKDATDAMIASSIGSGIMQQANSLSELAAKLQIPADTFQATVTRYNQMAASGVDTDFGKPAKDLFQLNTAPYYGITLGASALTTLDGLIIDKDCRVLDKGRNVIKGLYAIGDCSGGFFAHNYPELLAGLASGRTMTQARHAVRMIAGEISA